jgi:ribose 5-phosphate isomerase RpiB
MMGQGFGFIKGQVAAANGFSGIRCSVKDRENANRASQPA